MINEKKGGETLSFIFLCSMFVIKYNSYKNLKIKIK